MDKGAHFYKCDFQVHTPRDRNWTGSKFGVDANELEGLSAESVTEISEGRIQFAKEYLKKVREAGLNAIAITDHHDVVFAKIIRKVAEEENAEYIASANPENVVLVYPGIELSLANPASQAILLFDADFPDTDLDSVIHFLGINPTRELEKHTVETQRISQEIINDLLHLHKKLNELAYCRGKYIILPHVGYGSQHSILRQGFHEHYRKMPCVGGYVDKAISQETGYQNKINGGDVHYGNKAIAVISTSDNRYEDGRELGAHSTWVKWAEPTAEAIRQACLAKESRISQAEPELPQIYIRSVDVTASKFLGTFNINLNRQYNALIGGRGTGKSTILEYLRWGLCDQTIQSADFDELSVIERRRTALIQKTLADVKGEVRVTMIKNGITHIVKRNTLTREILLKIGEGDFQQVKEDDVRKLLPVQAYSQKQLSDVGVRTEELKRFIEQPILNQLNAIKSQLSEIAAKLKSSYTQLVRKREIEQEIDKYKLESTSLVTQVESIRNSLKGITPVDQETIGKKAKYEIEQSYLDSTKTELELFERKTDELAALLESYPEQFNKFDEIENKELLGSISTELNSKFVEIIKVVSVLKKIFGTESLSKLNGLLSEWFAKKAAFETEYESAKSKSQSSQQQLQEIQQIEDRISEINKGIAERKSKVKELGDPEVDFAAQRQNWKEAHSRKVTLLNEQAVQFTQLSKNLIKAEITKNIDLLPFKNQIKQLFEGTRIREDRMEAIIEKIRQSGEPLTEYVRVADEFRLLSELKSAENKDDKVPETPILTSCGFTEDHKRKLCGKITVDDWLKIATNELDFTPHFFYSTNNALGDVIPFSDASAGQQATSLLTVLLNQPGIPLLIDQPEDDIDNRAIEQIISNIWDAKKKRQLLFTSHNANLVVNGDSELVVCCDYSDSTNQTRGIIKAEGAIDTKQVRNEITSVMEGGEKAFKLRKDKYGF